MEVTGKITHILPEANGNGRNGAWRSRDAVLQTQDQYPKSVCFNLFGDKIDQFQFDIGDMVTVSFDIDSREYNGRWFTNIRAWKVENQSKNEGSNTPTPPQAPPYEPTDSDVESSKTDDLPF